MSLEMVNITSLIVWMNVWRLKNGWLKDDNITDDESLVKFAEYKSEFKRQQLNQFFVLHRQIIHRKFFFCLLVFKLIGFFETRLWGIIFILLFFLLSVHTKVLSKLRMALCKFTSFSFDSIQKYIKYMR